MNVETLPFQEVLKRAPDIFEAVVVAGQRSGQINARRASERVEYEIDDLEEDYPLMDEINEDYVEQEKTTVLAMQEFLADGLTWRFPDEDENDPASEEA